VQQLAAALSMIEYQTACTNPEAAFSVDVLWRFVFYRWLLKAAASCCTPNCLSKGGNLLCRGWREEERV
jgi:hypothetical protein